MSSDSYYNSKEFHAILQDYLDCERRGIPCIISSDDYTDIAEYYQQKGDLEKSRDVINKAMKLYPGFLSPFVFRARMAMLIDNNVKDAKKYINMVDASESNHKDYYLVQAEIMLTEQQADLADEYLEECMNLLEDEELEDFILDAATDFADFNEMELAKKWVERIEDKDSSDYLELKARVLINQYQFEESQKILKEIIDKDPFNAYAWDSLAASQYLNDQLKDSITSSEYALAINPQDDEALYNKANCLHSLGNYEDALIYYQRYSKLRPNEESCELFQGSCYMNLEKYEDAAKHFEKALMLYSSNHAMQKEIYRNLSLVYSRLRNYTKALECVDKASELGASSVDMDSIRAHILLMDDKFNEAKLIIEKVFKDSHYEPQIVLRIAVSLLDNGWVKQSYQLLSSLVKGPDCEEKDMSYVYLALCCKELKKWQELIVYLELAVEKDPEETKHLLSQDYPAGLEPEEYVEYEKKLHKL